MTIEIFEVNDARRTASFIDLPYRLRGEAPHWVLPLRVQVSEIIDRAKHPFFEHADARFFIAERHGIVVGRIAAINDRTHNVTHAERTTHFGLFDCEDDKTVASALFAAVEQQAEEWGHDTIRGPFNLSVHEEIGLQISGFDRPNSIMIPGNPAYYADLVAAQGYTKHTDLYCYDLPLKEMNARVLRIASKLEQRLNIKVRASSKKRIDEDAAKIGAVYNAAWQQNWPWYQATEHEFRHIIQNLKQVADYDLVLIAEDQNGEIVGFSAAIPNVNEALARNRSGKLFPFEVVKLLWRTRPKALRTLRVIAMGVLEEWRGKGIDTIFHVHQRNAAMENGFSHAELSQVLETNTMMQRTAELVGGTVSMTHRLYEKRL